ncbi:MAG: hypothetical protein ACFE0P_06930 [Oceanicaulis sp.]
MALYDALSPAPRVTAPDIPVWLRRTGPAALALGLHAGLLGWLIWFAGEARLEPEPARIVNIELVTAPAEPEPVVEPEPAAVPIDAIDAPAPAVTEPAPLEPPAETASESAPETAAAPAPAESPPAGVVLDAPGGADMETAPPTRSSALAGIACARAFAGDDTPIGCEAGPGFDFSRHAGGEGAALVEALTEARFNALAGLYGAQLDPALRRLPGQQGMQVMTNRRMGMSGADEMRDSLPPMVPDPAFGD